MKANVFIFITIFTLLIGCSKKENAKSDLIDMSLCGQVKSVTSISYKAQDKFGEIIKGEREMFYSGEKFGTEKDKYTIFNSQGNKIEETCYNSDGSLYSKETYRYDKNGNKIEIDRHESDYILDVKSLYKFNSEGFLIEENRYFSDGSLISKSNYKYDDKGNQIEENKYDSDGSLNSKSIYKYDTKGHKIENKYYDANGKLNGWIVLCKYDEKGNQIEISLNNQDGSLFSKNIFEYDNKGNKLERNDYNSDNQLEMKINYKYDNMGNEIESIQNYTLINEPHSPDKSTYKYVFDDKNNWISMTEFINEVPQHIIERDIKYFK